MMDYDELGMFFCEPYHVNDYITIKLPTIGEIIKYGEKDYYSMIFTLTCIPSDLKSQLFDMGIDYEEISDFELFAIMTKGLTKDKTSLIFGDLDLSAMEFIINEDNNKFILKNFNTNEIIDELAYIKIAGYLRMAHNIKPKIEKAANKTTKKILIQLDRDKIAKSKKEPYKSQLKPLVSAMMRYPGFKYKSSELKECGIYEFMDTIQGAQIYISSTALIQGSYFGMIDTSKIKKNEFNWMRSQDD